MDGGCTYLLLKLTRALHCFLNHTRANRQDIQNQCKYASRDKGRVVFQVSYRLKTHLKHDMYCTYNKD